ncbi:hypothetical protein BGZ52_010337 [Haplosporangium bisporale]|nr:hypothetical protein BGZ52_010337 [Haplosporangium bisporale]
MANSKPKNHKKIRISILNSNKENRDTAMAELALNKGKQRKDSKDSKESKKSRSSKSNSSSVSTCLLEQLGPTSMDMNLSDLPAKLAPFNDSLAQLQISRLHSSFYHDQDLASLTTLSTPTSDTFLPSPSSIPPKQEPKRKRLSTGSMQLGQFLANTFKPKHCRSTTSGSSHATTVHPDLSTARKALLVTRANEVVTTPELADAKPPKQRKRRSLFAKLPKLDTRAPKIVISAPIKGKPKVPKITQDGGDPQELSDEQQSADESGSGSAPFVFTPALLSPFYLPNPPRSKTAIHGGSNSNQLGLPGGVAVDDNLEYNEKAAPPNLRVKEPQWTMDWRHDSRVYYDDRWDRASILTVDSEMIRLAEDPDFPEYPERNAYWEQHCQIRERRWKQQLQQYAQDKDDPTGRWMKNKAKAGAMTAVSEDSASLLAEEEDERAEDLDNDTQRNKRFHHVTMLLHTAANPAEAARAAAQQAQSRQRRTRYSSYSAYMAAMQLKSRNRTDRKRYSVDAIATSPPRDDLPRISPKLIEDVRALKERSLQQKAEQRPNYVKTITDRFEGVPDSDSDTSPVRNGVPVFPLVVQKQQSKFLSPLDASSSRRGMGINAGSSDDDDDEFSCRTPAQRIQADYQVSQEFPSPQRQQQPDSGILFVASTTTTVEVFPGLNHDPQAPLSNPRIENADGESNKRKYSAIAQDSKGKDRFRSVACVATERQYLPLLDARDDGFLESMERMPSNDSFSSTEIDPLLQQALPPSPLSSGSKVASLGRIRGTKTRASVSYTAMPTMAQPATIPLCPSFTSASGSTLFLPSSSSSQMASHLLRHRASGSMTSGTLTGGMTTPTSMTSRSPTTRSWADLSQYPSSASMMLLDSLSSPMKVAYMLQPGSQRKTESQGGKKGGRSLSVSILSSALRKPIFGGGSDEVQSPRLPETEADPMMDHTGDEEADKEMEQELVDEVQGDVCGSPSNKVSKKRFRAMTMVELSVASPLQFKAEPSTSTSTMVTLHSEGRYQWNQFFDV